MRTVSTYRDFTLLAQSAKRELIIAFGGQSGFCFNILECYGRSRIGASSGSASAVVQILDSDEEEAVPAASDDEDDPDEVPEEEGSDSVRSPFCFLLFLPASMKADIRLMSILQVK